MARAAGPLSRNVWFLQLLLGFGLLVAICQSQGLAVIGPKIIRPNTTYTVAFTNSLPNNVRLEAILQGFSDGNNAFTRRVNVVVSRKTGRTIPFEVGDIPQGEYSLSIKSVDQSFSFEENVELLYDGKTMSILIQTDKPVYNPGDIMRFRVVVMDIDTRPVNSTKTVRISLTDTENNSIRQWPFAALYKGVFESQFQLASSPVLGEWTLAVTAGEHIVEKRIELREHILPKFFVKAYPSKVLLAEEKTISVTVDASYTFGQPVDGTAKVDLYFEPENRKPDFSSFVNITGSVNIEFKLKSPVEIEEDVKGYKDVILKVTVMEAFTNRTVNITELVPVFLRPYEISLKKSTPLFRPGVPFKLDLLVNDHFGEPAVEGKDVEITIRYEGSDLEEEIDEVKPLNDRGFVPLELVPPENAHQLIIKAKYDSVDYETIETIDGAQSKSKQYIRITTNAHFKAVVNKEVTFEISCTETMNYISYLVVSRGNIVAANTVLVNKKKYNLKLRLTPKMSPKSRIIVYYTNKNYLIFDQLEFEFDTFNNKFKFEVDRDEYQPGEDIRVDVDADKDSYIAMQAIDQSVLLLGRSGHDFTRNDVLKDLALYGATEPNEFDPFNTMGLFMRTTAVIDIPYPRNYLNRIDGHGSYQPRKIVQAIHIRTVFPDSWLWHNFTMDGRRTQKMFLDTVPDSITTWFVTGFALSPTTGLGIMHEPVKLTVKKPFFLIANLPYSIKRDEVTLIQVTIFNFLGNRLTADVTLYNKNDEIEFVEKSSDDKTRRTKAVIVPSNNGKPISFMVKAKKLGEIAIKLEVVTLIATDAIEHMLRVVPESHLYEKNEARFIELDQHGTQKFDIPVSIPLNIDEGSTRIMFTLDADILGTAISNLDGLIRLPTGCGEQNMLNFVPNIVVLDYLSETGTIADTVKTKAINFLQSGYQNQLKYKRPDGSFSVWGGSDTKGSTFLTAFVAKSFKIADKYLDAIDKSIVVDAFRWLAKNQNADGRFEEVGRVIHSDMQGGLRSSNFALTAYVLIAFLENQDIAAEHRAVVQKTTNYLVSNFDNINDAYDLSLATCALSMGRHPKRLDFLNKLVENSIFDRATKVRYWNRTAVGVEVAGYALLSYIYQESFVDATPIMRWLNQQRYGLGGFPGTQDTFVGLKALAKFAARTSSHMNKYRVTIRHKPSRIHTFDVDNKNSLNIQKLEIPNHVRNAQVEIAGIGHGVFQVAYQYFQNIQDAKPSFGLNLQLLNTTTAYVQHLQICVKYISKEAYQLSNMALVEVFFPSGLVADENSVQDMGNQIQKTELRFAATSVVVYYDNLGPTENCFRVTATRRYKVALHRPANVVVYDYYHRDRFAIKTYEGKVMQLCDICEDEDCETLSC